MTPTPWPHQLEGITFAEPKPATMIAAEMGCIDGNAVIVINRAGNTRHITLREAYRLFKAAKWTVPWKCRCLQEDRFGQHIIQDIIYSGLRPTIEITLDNGMSIRCTSDHQIAQPNGSWIAAIDLIAGSEVLTNGVKVPHIPVACPGCGIIRELRPSEANRGRKWCPECCSKGLQLKRGANNHSWKGGRFVDCDGYVRVTCPTHPRANTAGQVYEHIIVLETVLNRPITTTEHIHHINRNKADNRPENLEILTPGDHRRKHDPVLHLDGGSTIHGGTIVMIPKIAHVVSIKPGGQTDVYDIAMTDPWHNFVANGIVVHNCGKTAIAIHLQQRWNSRRTLIICPTSVRGVWRRELPFHTDGAITPVILDRGTVRERTQQAADAMRWRNDPIVIVINIEASWREPFRSWALSQRWDTVIYDEAHHIKNDGTECGDFAAALTPIADRRLCLTGTPLAHSPLDAWGQYRFLDPSLFGTDHSTYLARYAAPRQMRARKRYHASYVGMQDLIEKVFGADSPILNDWQEPLDISGWFPGMRHAKEFAEMIAPITWQCKSADVLDLPPLITDERQIDMGPEAQRIYNELERNFSATLGFDDISINSHLTLLTRLQQITSGFIPTDDKRIHRIDNAKKKALYDLLAEAGEPTIVFCRYTADLDAVQDVAEQLGLRYGELSGRRHDATTNIATLADDIDVAGVMPQSGGEGIDLSRAGIGIFYSLAQNLAEYDQSVARLHRPGTTGTRLYSLICGGTIDRDIHTAIADRREIIQHVSKRIMERNMALCPTLK